MKHRPIRMPRWILAGMPFLWGALCLGHTEGSGVLLLWLLLGTIQRQPQYPYPRKSRSAFLRLFFAFSGGVTIIRRFAGWGLSFAAYPGIAALSVIAASLLWQWRIPEKGRLIAGMILLITACM